MKLRIVPMTVIIAVMAVTMIFQLYRVEKRHGRNEERIQYIIPKHKQSIAEKQKIMNKQLMQDPNAIMKEKEEDDNLATK